MDIGEIYSDLLKHPHSPKIYRQLRDYYRSVGMEIEATAFESLLADNYGELPQLNHADDSSHNTQQREDDPTDP